MRRGRMLASSTSSVASSSLARRAWLGVFALSTWTGLAAAQTDDAPAPRAEAPDAQAPAPQVEDTAAPSTATEWAENAEDKSEDAAAGESGADAEQAEASATPADATAKKAEGAGDAAVPVEAEAGAEMDAGMYASDGISDADVDAFLRESDLESGSASGPTLDIYGFADFSYIHLFAEDSNPWRLVFSDGSFRIGNLNVYFDSQLAPEWRTLTEVRFTYLPYGRYDNVEDGVAARNKRRTSDYTRLEREVVVGGIVIERAWLQWSAHQLFNLKMGQWLTPYGIWNVDHGSPTIIPVARPFVIDEALMPESQAGLLAEGRVGLADQLGLKYALGLSNGRGPIDLFYDYDENKAVTGRLQLEYTGLGELQLGVSGFTGRYTDATVRIGLDGDELYAEDVIYTQYDEVAFGADLKYTNGGFSFQAEALMQDIAFTDEGRPELVGKPGSLAPDVRRWGTYGVVGYRFPWLGIMPFAMAEYSPVPAEAAVDFPERVVLLGGGLNIRPIASVVLKLDFTTTFFPNPRPTTFDEHNVHRLATQAAWAF